MPTASSHIASKCQISFRESVDAVRAGYYLGEFPQVPLRGQRAINKNT